MSQRPPTPTFVKSKSQNVDRYKRSFVTQTICELKFPTLLELAEARPPPKFANALRKSYPTLEAGREVKINLGQGTTESIQAHIFRALKGGWVATLKHSSASIEGSRYDGYPDLKRRVKQLVDAALPVIDAEIWTRVGLRFVNVIQGDDGQDLIRGWVNPALVAPIISDDFNKIGGYGGVLQLGGDEAGIVLRHQLQIGSLDNDGQAPSLKYMLDIDTFRTGVLIEDTLDVLDELHAQSFDFFDWSLGEGARELLMSEPK